MILCDAHHDSAFCTVRVSRKTDLPRNIIPVVEPSDDDYVPYSSAHIPENKYYWSRFPAGYSTVGYVGYVGYDVQKGRKVLPSRRVRTVGRGDAVGAVRWTDWF
jgi:hypothetical protein